MAVARQTKPDRKTELVDQLLVVAPEAMVVMIQKAGSSVSILGLKSCSGTPNRS